MGLNFFEKILDHRNLLDCSSMILRCKDTLKSEILPLCCSRWEEYARCRLAKPAKWLSNAGRNQKDAP
jgi:hypothetical protein